MMSDATPNIDQKKFPDIQDYSDWQSARILELTKHIAALEAKVRRLTARGFEDLHYENQQLNALLDEIAKVYWKVQGDTVPDNNYAEGVRYVLNLLAPILKQREQTDEC